MRIQHIAGGHLHELEDRPAPAELVEHVRREHRIPLVEGWSMTGLDDLHDLLHEIAYARRRSLQ